MTQQPVRLLLVDDEDDFRGLCAKWMRQKGYDVEQCGSGVEAGAKLDKSQFDVAVLDINMPGMSGLELLQRIRDAEVDVEVLMLTGENTIASAVAAMKLGASDYLTKPCALGDLEHHIQLAHGRSRLRKENRQLKAVLSRSRRKSTLVGNSLVIKETLRKLRKIAPTDKPVLIQGESGTGKEVVARLIQESSPLHDKPFVTINCAALPEQLVESELFGHQKGSFTGATDDKLGLFEIADGGTLFIDEIGEMPLGLQPKLLRVLEDGWLRSVGSHQERRVNVRLIAATNRDLKQEVAARNFREDLYYRINVLQVDLPRLRDREGDVDCLIDYFLPEPWTIDNSARQAMNRYHWPGNVRQLMNVLQRATVLADHEVITCDDLPDEIAREAIDRGGIRTTTAVSTDSNHDSVDTSLSTPNVGDRELRLDELARAHVLEVLAMADGNKAAAARKLGIHRRKLYRLLERFDRVTGGGIS